MLVEPRNGNMLVVTRLSCEYLASYAKHLLLLDGLISTRLDMVDQEGRIKDEHFKLKRRNNLLRECP